MKWWVAEVARNGQIVAAAKTMKDIQEWADHHSKNSIVIREEILDDEDIMCFYSTEGSVLTRPAHWH